MKCFKNYIDTGSGVKSMVNHWSFQTVNVTKPCLPKSHFDITGSKQMIRKSLQALTSIETVNLKNKTLTGKELK